MNPKNNTLAKIRMVDLPRLLHSDVIVEWQLIRTLFKRNYLHRYASARFSHFWLLIMPCLPVFIYNLLQALGVFADAESTVPRSIFLSIGVLIYYVFSETLTGISGATLTNSNYIINSGIPKITLICAECLEVIANFLIRFVGFTLVSSILIAPMPWTILLLPLMLIPMIAIGLTFGLIINLFSVLYKDLTNVIQTISLYLLFASGVFLAIPDGNKFFELLKMSPLYQLICYGRTLSISVPLPEPDYILPSFIFSFLFLPFSLLAFYRSEKLVNSYL